MSCERDKLIAQAEALRAIRASDSAVGVTPDLDALVAALGYQKQIDEDGTFVSVSRQAVCEARDFAHALNE